MQAFNTILLRKLDYEYVALEQGTERHLLQQDSQGGPTSSAHTSPGGSTAGGSRSQPRWQRSSDGVVGLDQQTTPPQSRRGVVCWAAVVGALLATCAVLAGLELSGNLGVFSQGRDGPTGRPLPLQWRSVAAAGNLSALDLLLLKPTFHVMPLNDSWLNDPNGMLQHQGLTHVFYQHQPYRSVWGTMHWGHAVSRDLVRWQHLPIALWPDAWFDRDGCFSGSAVLQDDGTPALLYTGVMNFSQLGYYYQSQALAVPSDPRDAMLTHWSKPLQYNPLDMKPPPGGDRAQFRDPITAWKVPLAQAGNLPLFPNSSAYHGAGGGSDDPGGGGTVWFTAVGALDDCVGSAALYASPDLRQWEYAGTLFSQLGQNFTYYDVCLFSGAQGTPPGARSYGGPCDAIGPKCRMWECPDYFQLLPGESAGAASSPPPPPPSSALPLDTAKSTPAAVPERLRLVNGNIIGGSIGSSSGGSGPAVGSGGGGAGDETGGAANSAISVFKYSDQMRGRPTFAADWYVLGSASLTNYTAAAFQDGFDVFTPQLVLGSDQSELVEPILLDYGTVYASKSFTLADGRRLWLAWAYEDAVGCTEMCADGTPFTRALGWQGMLTFPRELSYEPVTRQLLMQPIQELERLRLQPPLFNGSSDTFSAPTASTTTNSSSSGTTNSSSSGSENGGAQEDLRPASGPACMRRRDQAMLTRAPQSVTHNATNNSAAANGTSASAGAGDGGDDGSLSEAAGAGGSVPGLHYSRWVLIPEGPILPNSTVASILGSALDPTWWRNNSTTAWQRLQAQGTLGGQLRRRLELQANFTLALQPAADSAGSNATAATTLPAATTSASAGGVFEVGLRLLTGDGHFTAMFVNGTVSGADSAQADPWVVDSAGLYVDRTCSGGMTRPGTQGGTLRLDNPRSPAAGGAAKQETAPGGAGGGDGISRLGVQLQVLVDHSTVEVFAQGGRARITSRIYPAGGPLPWGVEAYAMTGGSALQGQGVSFQAAAFNLDLGWVQAV